MPGTSGVWLRYAKPYTRMKVFFVCTLMCTVFCMSAFSQNHHVAVGGKTLDSNTIDILHRLNPNFSQYGDSSIVADLVAKYYVVNKYLSGLATTEGLDKSEEISRTTAILTEMIREELLSTEYQRQKLNAIKISDKEAYDFYDNNRSALFSNSGHCDFFQVETSDTSATTVARIRKALKEKMATPEAERMYIKISADSFMMSYAKITTANKEYPLFTPAFHSAVNSLQGPFRPKGYIGWYYIYITSRSDVTYQSYEEVKGICIDQVRVLKQNALLKEWHDEALKKYPVQLTPAPDKVRTDYELKHH